MEHDPQTLMAADRTVERVPVGEVVSRSDAPSASADRGSNQIRQPRTQVSHQSASGIGIEFLVVVTGIEVASMNAPMLTDDLRHRQTTCCQDTEPQQHGPQAILLAHMVRSGACTFFTANRDFSGVEEIAEEFQPRRCLETGDAESLRSAVGGAAGWHRARDPLDARLISRD